MIQEFYTYKKLQGSQTTWGGDWIAPIGFTLIRNYKVLKQQIANDNSYLCFTLIRNYKVLKLTDADNNKSHSFTLIRNYKVLKQDFFPTT